MIRLKSLLARAERYCAIIPRHHLFLVTERLISHIVDARGQRRVVFLVSQLAPIVIIEPFSGVSGSAEHIIFKQIKNSL